MQQFQESPIYFIVVYLYEKINEHHLDSRQKHGFKQFIVNILKETILSETKVLNKKFTFTIYMYYRRGGD